METPKGYDEIQSAKGRLKKYMVFINNIPYGETMAVSPEKAANNIRWQIYRESSGWWDVPAVEDFDCVEV